MSSMKFPIRISFYNSATYYINSLYKFWICEIRNDYGLIFLVNFLESNVDATEN